MANSFKNYAEQKAGPACTSRAILMWRSIEAAWRTLLAFKSLLDFDANVGFFSL